MKINARLQNSRNDHQVTLQTDENIHSIHIPPRASGLGSSANGGELLLLALASEEEIRDLMRFTDTVAEIHNTFRVETPFVLSQIEAIPT